MLKYIKNHLTSIDGIEIFPIISLVIFVTFFVFLIWGVMTIKKSSIEEMKKYPLLNHIDHN